MRFLLSFLLFVLLTGASAQKVYQSIKGEFKLPTSLANSALRKTGDGIADVSLSYQLPIFKGIGLGVGYNHLYLRVNESAVNIQDIVNGSMHRKTPFGKLFYERVDDQFTFESGLKVGYSYISYLSDKLEVAGIGSTKDEGLFLEPYVNIGVLAQENLSISLNISYSYTDFAYGPNAIGLETFPGFLEEEHKGPTHFFSIGFGFSAYLIGNKRRR